MKKDKKPEQFIQHPGYPGGTEALRKFVKENLRYPKEALKNKIEGIVAVKYEIDHNGKVFSAKIKSGLGYGCDEEALRVVKLLKFGSAKHKGLRVTFNKTININFKLPASPKSTSSSQLVYNYVEKKGDQKSYSYNIKIG